MKTPEKYTWESLVSLLEERIGQRPADVADILFLIGIQELGAGPQSFKKQEKEQLIHIGLCRVLSYSGFYKFTAYNAEGWPEWEKAEKIPRMSVQEQEMLIKENILVYFSETLETIS